MSQRLSQGAPSSGLRDAATFGAGGPAAHPPSSWGVRGMESMDEIGVPKVGFDS